MNWTRHELGWIDNTTGLLWHFARQNKLNLEEAKAWAEEQGGRLPTRDEFKVAEKNGVRKLDGLDWNNWFWSSTPYGDYDAYAFDGYDGSAYYYYDRDDRVSDVFARCVSAAPGVKPLISDSDLLPERILRAKALLKEAMELLDRADAEIVRLREENHALRAGFSASDEFGKIKCLELKRSESKRAKLREALQFVIDDCGCERPTHFDRAKEAIAADAAEDCKHNWKTCHGTTYCTDCRIEMKPDAAEDV